MKRRTNLSLVDGLGIRREMFMELGDTGNFISGTLLDANATTTLVDQRIADVIGGAPEALNTLLEVAGSIPTKVSQLQNDSGYLTQHQDISQKADKSEIPTVPTNVSAFTNDSGYLTEHQSLANYALKSELFSGSYDDLSNKPTIPTVPTNISAFTNDSGYLTQHQSLSDYATQAWVSAKFDDLLGIDAQGVSDLATILSDDDTTTGILNVISSKANSADLANVATSGNYNDLSNKPANVSSFTNDAGYLTQHQDISGKANASDVYTKREMDVALSPSVQHDYVEIGGVKWATTNIGASSVTDSGLYFQWADTQGYTVDQVGNGTGQKAFDTSDYKYLTNNGTTFTSPYDSTDVLQSSDDAATAAWGNCWRVPTIQEFQSLLESTTVTISSNYNNSGVSGMVFTDTSDNTKILFLPCASNCIYGAYGDYEGSYSYYWANSKESLNGKVFGNLYDDVVTISSTTVYTGLPIRAVYDPTIQPLADVAFTGSYNDLEDKPTSEIAGKVDQAISKTYAQLKAMRDGGTLKPGQWYRITDYTCTTTQAETRSADNVFDILVLALTNNELSETAFATHHAGDTYFANSNLAAWELKYCLDNDTNRFAWADGTNGKGVIYWMKDEWNNECPYDFKNIQFAVRQLTGSSTAMPYSYLTRDQFTNSYLSIYNFANNNWVSPDASTIGNLKQYMYTFSNDTPSRWMNNKITPYMANTHKQYLNNIILGSNYSTSEYNTFENCCNILIQNIRNRNTFINSEIIICNAVVKSCFNGANYVFIGGSCTISKIVESGWVYMNGSNCNNIQHCSSIFINRGSYNNRITNGDCIKCNNYFTNNTINNCNCAIFGNNCGFCTIRKMYFYDNDFGLGRVEIPDGTQYQELPVYDFTYLEETDYTEDGDYYFEPEITMITTQPMTITGYIKYTLDGEDQSSYTISITNSNGGEHYHLIQDDIWYSPLTLSDKTPGATVYMEFQRFGDGYRFIRIYDDYEQ